MFMKVVASLLVALLMGCAPNWQAIAQRSNQTRKSCEAELASGNLKNHLEVEQCANPSIRADYAAAGDPDMDLVDEYLTRREAIAAQLDRGAIPVTEAAAERASAAATANSEAERRETGRAARAAAIMSTMPVTCTKFGAVTTCN
jgi:hypothetical protein